MSRYHFSLIDHELIADIDGHDCDTVAEAMVRAADIAARLAQARPQYAVKRYSIVIFDEDGDEVGRAVVGGSTRTHLS